MAYESEIIMGILGFGLFIYLAEKVLSGWIRIGEWIYKKQNH